MSYEFKRSDAFDFAGFVNAETRTHNNELFFKFCPHCNGGGKDKNTFSINLENGTFNCFRASCGYKGNFVELARDFGFKLETDDGKVYRKLPQVKPQTTERAIEYLKSRGISEETARKYKITTRKDNKDILVFPFYDEQGTLQFIKYRNTKFSGKGNKEWCETDTMPILFGMSECKGFDTLIITEGQIDSLSVAECGFDNAVSVPTGAKGFTWLSHNWEWIVKFKEIVVFGDCEKGAVTLSDELCNRLPQKVKIVQMADYLGEKDANAILQKYGADAIVKAVVNAQPKKLNNVLDLSEVKSVDLNSLPKIKTNIFELDRTIGGLIMGQVVLLSGKRGNGKSTFMSQLVCEALQQNESVFIYSGELAGYHFKRWLDYQLAGSDNLKCYKNEYGEDAYTISEQTIEKINRWYKGRAFIFDNNFIPENDDEFTSITKTIENVIKQYGCKMICIDNLMTAMDCVDDQSNLYLAQSNFVGALKKIAVKYDAVIILVAHPRKSKDGFTNDDVSGSSDITNKVDIVMSYERAPDGCDYDGKLQVTKNRLLGKYATNENAIKLFYSNSTKRITSATSKYTVYGWEEVEKKQQQYEDLPFI